MLARKNIKAVCAIINDDQGRVLVAKRPAHTSYAGCWEFPGGKIEPGETMLQALARELKEEVGLGFKEASFLQQLQTQDHEKSLLIAFWHIKRFSGQAQGLEGQQIRWVWPAELTQLNMLLANQAVVRDWLKQAQG